MLFLGCKPGVPSDIIQPEKMEKILFDIHVADGYATSIPFVDSAKSIVPSIYKGIYQKYDIDSAMQAKSMNYYYRHPDVLSKMYENISARLKVAKDKQEAIEKKEIEKRQKEIAKKAKEDSVKNAKNKKIDTLKLVKKDSLKLMKDTLKSKKLTIISKRIKPKSKKDSMINSSRLNRKLRKLDIKSVE